MANDYKRGFMTRLGEILNQKRDARLRREQEKKAEELYEKRRNDSFEDYERRINLERKLNKSKDKSYTQLKDEREIELYNEGLKEIGIIINSNKTPDQKHKELMFVAGNYPSENLFGYINKLVEGGLNNVPKHLEPYLNYITVEYNKIFDPSTKLENKIEVLGDMYKDLVTEKGLTDEEFNNILINSNAPLGFNFDYGGEGKEAFENEAFENEKPNMLRRLGSAIYDASPKPARTIYDASTLPARTISEGYDKLGDWLRSTGVSPKPAILRKQNMNTLPLDQQTHQNPNIIEKLSSTISEGYDNVGDWLRSTGVSPKQPTLRKLNASPEAKKYLQNPMDYEKKVEGTDQKGVSVKGMRRPQNNDPIRTSLFKDKDRSKKSNSKDSETDYKASLYQQGWGNKR